MIDLIPPVEILSYETVMEFFLSPHPIDLVLGEFAAEVFENSSLKGRRQLMLIVKVAVANLSGTVILHSFDALVFTMVIKLLIDHLEHEIVETTLNQLPAAFFHSKPLPGIFLLNLTDLANEIPAV